MAYCDEHLFIRGQPATIINFGMSGFSIHKENLIQFEVTKTTPLQLSSKLVKKIELTCIGFSNALLNSKKNALLRLLNKTTK